MVQHVCTVYKTVISVLVMSYRADGGAVGGLGAGASQSTPHVHEGTVTTYLYCTSMHPPGTVVLLAVWV